MSDSNAPKTKRTPVQTVTINEGHVDQRIDNFLITALKGLPKSRIYRIIRKGEVRVNKKRVSASYHLILGDVVRIPPVYLPEDGNLAPPSQTTQSILSDRILYEDDNLIILNKPAGMSVHVGSTVRVGIIEAMRHMYPKLPQLELGHRLDSETSGCLILAKKKRVLREIHQLLRDGKVKKLYRSLTKDHWRRQDLVVDVPLLKNFADGGKHMVTVNSAGKSAHTRFTTIKKYPGASLMEVALHTGRTHQIRVHAAYKKHPIACDSRYGDAKFDQFMRQLGLRRMFLHAYSLQFTLPSTQQVIKVVAPLDEELQACLHALSSL